MTALSGRDGLTGTPVAEEGGVSIPEPYPGDIPLRTLSEAYAESAASTDRKDRGLTHRLNILWRGDNEPVRWRRKRLI